MTKKILKIFMVWLFKEYPKWNTREGKIPGKREWVWRKTSYFTNRGRWYIMEIRFREYSK